MVGLGIICDSNNLWLIQIMYYVMKVSTLITDTMTFNILLA